MSELSEIPRIDRLTAIFSRMRMRSLIVREGSYGGVSDVPRAGDTGHLLLLRGGRLRVESDGASVVIDGPAAALLPRPTAYRLAADAPVELVAAELWLGGAGSPIERGLPTLLPFSLAGDPSSSGALELLFAQVGEYRCGRQVILDRLIEILLVHLFRLAIRRPEQCPGLFAGLGHPALARVLVQLHDRPAHDWTLERMAEEAGMSRTTFAGTFRRVVGQTPGDYLQSWRLQLARAALADGRSLRQAAHDVGYESHAALSRALSRHRCAPVPAAA
ncbi:MAG TPA: AraC family transcriptional regulator [Azospirillaceae bacterium]|nr:AraC family transcriptional regulator [Azospirillaceae bacterium]